MSRRHRVELDLTEAELAALWSTFCRGRDEMEYEGDDWRADGRGRAFTARVDAIERVERKLLATAGVALDRLFGTR